MEVSIVEEHNLINLEYDNKKFVCFKGTINILFIFDNNKCDNLSINRYNSIDLFQKKKSKCLKYLILIYEYNGDDELLTYFKKNYKFNFINYINLNIYWYSLIYRYNNIDYIYEEKIFNELYDKIYFNIDINLDSYSFEKYTNIGTDIKIFDEEISSFIDDLKNISLEEITNRKRRIFLQYNNLEKYITNIDSKYKMIADKIQTKKEDIKKLNENILKINSKKNSNIDTLLKEKNDYLINLLNYIEITEDKKNKTLVDLNNINSLIDNKKDNISLLKNEIETLKNTKVSFYKQISKLKNSIENQNYIVRNLAVMVHIYNLSIWDDIYSYLKNLYNVEFDLYINLAANETEIFKLPKYIDFINNLSNIKECQNLYITYSDNKGMDIGGFIISYMKMLDLGLNYNSIIKIHTKSNDNWRFAMLYSLLGTEKIINNNIKLIQKNDIGMIGNDLIPLGSSVNTNSYKFINVYNNIFKLNFNKSGYFVPGTIFWIKGSILRKYFNKKNLNITYNTFEKDYCGLKDNISEGRPHAFERFFGMLVESSNKISVRFDSNPDDFT